MHNIDKKKTQLQKGLLYDDVVDQEFAELLANNLYADLNQLFTTLQGDELVEAVIRSTQDFIAEQWVGTADTNLEGVDLDTIKGMRIEIRQELTKVIARFISDEHREVIVRHHARGLSTAEAVETLINENSVMKRLAQRDAIGEKKLKELLVSRLSYLKPGTARWPKKKYGAVWREEREQYIQEISNTPFSTPAERIALLANHAERVNHTLKNKQHSVNDLQALTASLTQTLESLEKLSPIDQQASMNVSTSQLPALLERLTIALEAFQQIAHNDDTNLIVEVVERLTLALQPLPEQLAITHKTEENTPHDRDQPVDESQN